MAINERATCALAGAAIGAIIPKETRWRLVGALVVGSAGYFLCGPDETPVPTSPPDDGIQVPPIEGLPAHCFSGSPQFDPERCRAEGFEPIDERPMDPGPEPGNGRLGSGPGDLPRN